MPAPNLDQLRQYAVARTLFSPTTLPRALAKLDSAAQHQALRTRESTDRIGLDECHEPRQSPLLL